MSIWEPFDPVSYFLHIVLGGLGILAALVALSALKGSLNHIRAGRLFVFAAFVAAATAIAFSFSQFSGAAIASSVITFSCLGAALLALKPKSKRVFLGEIVTTTLMGLAFMWMLFGASMSIQADAWLMPLLYSLIAGGLLVSDIRFFRLDEQRRREARLPRHFSRMAFAFAIAVHAPIVTFSGELGLDPMVAFFGPYVIWPAIVIFFKRRQAKGKMALAY